MSDSLQPHGLQHARLLCPSLSLWVYSNWCPLSQWCHPTISSFCCHLLLLPSVVLSITVFSNESVLHIRWLKYQSFSFSISPSNEYSGLISFRMDWFALLAVQGTLKSLLYHHSSKPSILQYSACFMVQSGTHTGKTIALTRRTIFDKMPCLCFSIHCLGLSWLFFKRASIF